MIELQDKQQGCKTRLKLPGNQDEAQHSSRIPAQAQGCNAVL